MLGIKYPQIDKDYLTHYIKPVDYTFRELPFTTAYDIVTFMTTHTAFINSNKLNQAHTAKFSKAVANKNIGQAALASQTTHSILLDLDRKPHTNPTATDKVEVLTYLSTLFTLLTYSESWTASNLFKGRIGLYSTTSFTKLTLQTYLHTKLQERFGSRVEVAQEQGNYKILIGDSPQASVLKHEYLDAVAFNQSHIMFTYGNPIELWHKGSHIITTRYETIVPIELKEIPVTLNMAKHMTQFKGRYKEHPHTIDHIPQERIQKILDAVTKSASSQKLSVAQYIRNMKRGHYTRTTEVIHKNEVKLLVNLVNECMVTQTSTNCGMVNHIGSNAKGHLHINYSGSVLDSSHSNKTRLTLVEDTVRNTTVISKYKPSTTSNSPLLFISSATGTGKTHQYDSVKQTTLTIVITPTLDLRDDIASKGFLTKVETGEAIPDNTSVVMTYHKFAGHYNAKDVDFSLYRIVVDEAPRLFQAKQDKHTTNLDNLLKYLLDATEFLQVVMVSADYKFYDKFLQLPHTKHYEIAEYILDVERTVTVTNNMPNLDIDGFVVLYMNSKNKARGIRDQMDASGKNFAVVYADEDSISPSEIDKDLSLDGVIFTSKMREGYSIHRPVTLSVADATANGLNPSGVVHTIQALSRSRNCSNFMVVHSQNKIKAMPDLNYDAVVTLLAPLNYTDNLEASPMLQEFPIIYQYAKHALKKNDNLQGWKVYNNIIMGRLDYFRALNEFNNIDLFVDGLEEAGYIVKRVNSPKWLVHSKQPQFSGGSMEEWERVAKTDDKVRAKLETVKEKISLVEDTVDNLSGSKEVPESVVVDILNSPQKYQLLTKFTSTDYIVYREKLLSKPVHIRSLNSEFKKLGTTVNLKEKTWNIEIIMKHLDRVCLDYRWTDSTGGKLKAIRAKRELGQRGALPIKEFKGDDGTIFTRAMKGKLIYPAGGFLYIEDPQLFYDSLQLVEKLDGGIRC